MKKDCKNCAWNYSKERLPYCEANILDECSHFFSKAGLSLGDEEVKSGEVCSVCKRDKDIGKKCWWCGN